MRRLPPKNKKTRQAIRNRSNREGRRRPKGGAIWLRGERTALSLPLAHFLECFGCRRTGVFRAIELQGKLAENLLLLQSTSLVFRHRGRRLGLRHLESRRKGALGQIR